ncbi:MAG TPA: plasmid stabilization protein [Chloroflexota bacterium]|nr:plasmid stabilization protein [Chloroflexota bacterium]
MTFQLVRTSHFDRQLARFVRRHPDLKPRIASLLRDLESDPFQPHLRLHPLSGELEGIYAASLTHAYRLTLTITPTDQEIVLLDIGSHDDVYR